MVDFRTLRRSNGNTVYINPEAVRYIGVTVNTVSKDKETIENRVARVYFSETDFMEVEGNPDKVAKYIKDGSW